MFRLSLLFALIFTAGATAASKDDKDANVVYRWQDNKGNVHFSQQPPPGINATAVHINAPKPSSTPPSPPASALATPATEPGKDSQLANLAARMKEACTKAQENLKTLTTFDRVRMVNEKGEYEVLTDEQKAAQIAQYRQQIKTSCQQ
ncbi:DUF4124 domain-containing protein [Gallaecimonas mangrovi]|uniref:DUF4124 domain-containing protein n=1 Tax=Gallaecimonas mangrovi TaxID=2291597 RepID=UPI000E1FEDCA|nr:DUF4124 domain-containing protein [Gallaecimonas mangrovi]